jgi:hypothetical protein
MDRQLPAIYPLELLSPSFAVEQFDFCSQLNAFGPFPRQKRRVEHCFHETTRRIMGAASENSPILSVAP